MKPWGDERHLLVECSALAGVRTQVSQLRYLRCHGQADVFQGPAAGQQMHYSLP